jgi:hypothetical protein
VSAPLLGTIWNWSEDREANALLGECGACGRMNVVVQQVLCTDCNSAHLFCGPCAAQAIAEDLVLPFIAPSRGFFDQESALAA